MSIATEHPTIDKLRSLRAMIGSSDPQDAYERNSDVNALAKEILADEAGLVETMLNSSKIRNIYFHPSRKFSRDELASIGTVGYFGDEGSTYGGLLGAVLRGGESFHYSQFKQFAFQKIRGAMLDYVRHELGGRRKNNIRPISFESFRDESTGKAIEPEGTYFGVFDEESLDRQDIKSFMAAASNLKEPHKTYIDDLLAAMMEEGDAEALRRALKEKKHGPEYAAALKDALSELKFVYCKLDDDQLPDSITLIKDNIAAASSLAELAEHAYTLREAFGLRLKELGDKIGLSESRISQLQSQHRVSGEFLANLGVTDRHLPEFAVNFYPECWTGAYMDKQREAMRTANETGICSQLRSLLKAAAYHEPERTAELCGSKREKIKACFSKLRLGQLPANAIQAAQFETIMEACGLSMEQLPDFLQDRLQRIAEGGDTPTAKPREFRPARPVKEAAPESDANLSFPEAHARMMSHFTRDGEPLSYPEIQKGGELWMTPNARFMKADVPMMSVATLTAAREPFIAFVEALRWDEHMRAEGGASEARIRRELQEFTRDYDAYIATVKRIKEPKEKNHRARIIAVQPQAAYAESYERMVAHFTRDGEPLDYPEIQKGGHLWATPKGAFMSSAFPAISLNHATVAREPFIAFVETLRREEQERAGGVVDETKISREVAAFTTDYDAYLASVKSLKERGRDSGAARNH